MEDAAHQFVDDTDLDRRQWAGVGGEAGSLATKGPVDDHHQQFRRKAQNRAAARGIHDKAVGRAGVRQREDEFAVRDLVAEGPIHVDHHAHGSGQGGGEQPGELFVDVFENADLVFADAHGPFEVVGHGRLGKGGRGRRGVTFFSGRGEQVPEFVVGDFFGHGSIAENSMWKNGLLPFLE